MTPTAYLLIVLKAGIPMFVFSMPDAQSCAMNMKVLREAVVKEMSVGCFDMERQVWRLD